MKKSLLRRLCAAGLAIACVLLLCEGAGRLIQLRERRNWRDVAEKAVYRPDPLLGYALQPGLDTVYGRKTPLTTNSLGLREREFSPQKDEGLLRVICIGDSRTFGLGLEPGKTFSRKLERLLKAKYPRRRVEVINAGVPGYTSNEGARLVEEVLPRLHPDLVIASFGHNDRWRSPHREAEIAAILGAPPSAGRSGTGALLKKADDLLDRVPGYFDLKVKLRTMCRRAPLMAQSIEDEFVSNVPLDLYEENLRRMARGARRGGFRILLMHVTENPAIFDRTERGAELLREGRIEEAEAELRKAAAVPANFSPAPHYYLGLLHEQRGEADAAEEAFLMAEFGSRVFPHPLDAIGAIFARRGITKRSKSAEELSRMEAIRNPYGLIDAYADATRRAAAEEGVPFLVIGNDEANDSHYLDANHPSPEGNAFLAGKAFDAVDP